MKYIFLTSLLLFSLANAHICIDHAMGETCFDAVPERIVVLEYSFADHLGTLGVAPVGYARDAMPEYLVAFTEETGAEVVGTRAEPNLERITALQPDVIIADTRRHTALYEQLDAIAPTLIFNSLRGNYQDQLDALYAIASMLDKKAEARDILAEHASMFAEVQALSDSEAGDFLIGVLWSGGFSAHSSQSFMGSFLESLGRNNALEPVGGETQYEVDLEGIASINPSSIIILCATAEQEKFDAWQNHPLWQAFDAVKNDHVYLFNRNLWSKGRGVMAFSQILEDAQSSGLLQETANTAPLLCQ